jgi:hypothetical protein
MKKENLHVFSPEEYFVLKSIAGQSCRFSNDYSVADTHLFAVKNGLAPFLFHIYKDQKSTIPQALYNLLKKEYINSLVRNTKIHAVNKQIQFLLNSSGMEVISLKGIFLSANIYPDIALRPMSDIDILLTKDVDRAYDLLLSIGGTVGREEAEHDKNTGHHFPGILYKNVLIELHKSLFDLELSYQIDNSLIEKKIFTYKNFTSLNPLYNLIYFCLHAYSTMRNGGIRLSWFLDLILLHKSDVFKYSPKEFIDATNELGVKNEVLDILLKAEFIFNYHFNLIPDGEKCDLTQKEKNKFVKFIHASSQQNTNYSYRIAWERLRKSKGISNKVKFVISILTRDGSKDFGSIVKRLILVAKRSLGMLFFKR